MGSKVVEKHVHSNELERISDSVPANKRRTDANKIKKVVSDCRRCISTWDSQEVDLSKRVAEFTDNDYFTNRLELYQTYHGIVAFALVAPSTGAPKPGERFQNCATDDVSVVTETLCNLDHVEMQAQSAEAGVQTAPGSDGAAESPCDEATL